MRASERLWRGFFSPFTQGSWPSAQSLVTDHVKKQPVHAVIMSDLGMEGKCELLSIADSDDVVIHGREDVHVRRCRSDVGGANEIHLHVTHAFDRRRGDEASELAAIGISANRHRKRSEPGIRIIFQMLREEDHAGAGGKDRKPCSDLVLERCEKSLILEKLSLHGAFPAGKDEPVHGALEILPVSYLKTGSPELCEHSFMLDECALKGEDSNGGSRHDKYLF